ncbi:hypothetical protein F5Y07DRAFT_349872 [Xylaria sp. FL0933]|nr:hypothetical protein F5Y07DRAFT_349872 [Xylaria sp. FL0933]
MLVSSLENSNITLAQLLTRRHTYLPTSLYLRRSLRNCSSVMASGRRAQSPARIASGEQQPIDTTVGHATLLPSDGNELIIQGELSGPGHESEHVETSEAVRSGFWLPASQMWARVLGKEIPIQRRPVCETYDPDAPPPGTPEPESHPPERYAAWGQRHFGEEWYKLREQMLQERNIYVDHDLVYEQRQRDLRVLEHSIEGRPSCPGFLNGPQHPSWKSLWARLSKNFPKSPSPSPSPSSSPLPMQPEDNNNDDEKDNGSDDGNDTDLSGYSTFYPTPSPREQTPLPSDPFELLEYNRKRWNYNQATYQFERIFMLESFIDQRRKKREDEIGSNRREKVREETEKIGHIPGTTETWPEYTYLKCLFRDLENGMTQDQIEDQMREGEESIVQLVAWLRETGREKPIPRYDKEQLEERRRAWDFMGFSKEVQAGLTRRFAMPHLWQSTTDAVSNSREPSPPRGSTRNPREPVNRTRSGRITKNTTKAAGFRLASREHSPSQLHTKAATESRSNRKQPKTYVKERSSLRLAGMAPEFGLLPERGRRTAPSLFSNTPREPLPARRTGRRTSRKSRVENSAGPQEFPAMEKPRSRRSKRLAN